jgi:hypothetical protein
MRESWARVGVKKTVLIPGGWIFFLMCTIIPYYMAYMALYESTIDWLKISSPDCLRDDIVK